MLLDSKKILGYKIPHPDCTTAVQRLAMRLSQAVLLRGIPPLRVSTIFPHALLNKPSSTYA